MILVYIRVNKTDVCLITFNFNVTPLTINSLLRMKFKKKFEFLNGRHLLES